MRKSKWSWTVGPIGRIGALFLRCNSMIMLNKNVYHPCVKKKVLLTLDERGMTTGNACATLTVQVFAKTNKQKKTPKKTRVGSIHIGAE